MMRSPLLLGPVVLSLGLSVACSPTAVEPLESGAWQSESDGTQTVHVVSPPTLRATPPNCIPGELNCECTPNQTCLPAEGSIAVACEQGYCVAVTCPRGSEGCDCYGNNTCDPVEGVPMECIGGACVRSPNSAPGTLNAPCGDALRACDTHLGQALSCVGGSCQLADCPSGSLHCPCAARASCYGALICDDGSCIPPECELGARGCPCRDGAEPCDSGGLCAEGVCAPPRYEVVIDNVRVAGCEFVITENNVTPDDLVWSERIVGEHYHRSPRLGAAFVVEGEGGVFGAAAFSFVLSEPHSADEPTSVTLDSVHCFDSTGAPLGGAPLLLVAPGEGT